MRRIYNEAHAKIRELVAFDTVITEEVISYLESLKDDIDVCLRSLEQKLEKGLWK